jgi:hypothetical protein
MKNRARAGSGRPLLEDQTYTIETPEHVEIVHTVAGPGSRLLATIKTDVMGTIGRTTR